MKRFVILLFIIMSLALAVKPVSRDNKPDSDNKTTIEIMNKNQPNHYVQKQGNKKGDRFEDADSNSVNDRREDDFQKIKKMISKFKDQFKKNKGTSEKKKTK